MSIPMRRIAALSTGVFVLAIDAFSAPSAKAGGMTREAQCLAAGGTWGDPNVAKAPNATVLCHTPAADNECKAKIGEKKDYVTFFDVSTGKCRTIKGCYVTTACVSRVGLADDCFELSALRRFRDEDVAYMEGGKEMIDAYYRDAPWIVEAILVSGNASRELSRIYARFILPSALAASVGLPHLAFRIYTSMMRDLAGRYAAAGV